MPTTNDPNDPRLGYGPDTEPKPQEAVYLVLSAAERASGFVRPVRDSYIHKYRHPESGDMMGCGTVTYMGREIAETYAKTPDFYGNTYCMGCRMHLPVSQFKWDGTDEVVGS